MWIIVVVNQPRFFCYCLPRLCGRNLDRVSPFFMTRDRRPGRVLDLLLWAELFHSFGYLAEPMGVGCISKQSSLSSLTFSRSLKSAASRGAGYFEISVHSDTK